jgi:hypothetical protein
VPLAVRLTGANRNDSQEALALVDAIPPLQGERGARGVVQNQCSAIAATTPLRFDVVSGYVTSCPGWPCDAPSTEVALAGGAGVVEQTFAWLNQFRRLRVRCDRRADIHEAFLSLGCALIWWQSLRRAWNTD